MNTTISAVGRRRDDGRYEITETVIVERHVLSDAIDGYASRGVTVMFPPERAETPAALPLDARMGLSFAALPTRRATSGMSA